MANAHPTPRPENLRPPWTPGTSGNPAGYSRGRRISDAIESLIDEMALDRKLAATAIHMATGDKTSLKQKVQDPETGEDIWVEHKPNIAWFKMIMERIEPAEKQKVNFSVLDALLDSDERERLAQLDQNKASECPEPSRSDRCDCNQKAESAGELFRGVPARVDSGQVALKDIQTPPRAGDLVTTLAVERPFCHRDEQILHGLLELFNPARHALQLLAFLETQLAGLFTGGVRRFLPTHIRIRPRLGDGPRRALAGMVVVACFILFHQAIVLDHQSARDHVEVVRAAWGVEREAWSVDREAWSVRPEAGAFTRPRMANPCPTLNATRSTLHAPRFEFRSALAGSLLPVLYPVLAPERPPDGQGIVGRGAGSVGRGA